jgi:hypothetical protein
MKKFLVILFILLALGGACLFLGWAQRGVPPGAYGVMRSKTHGTDPRIIRDGEFRWIWYRLIPTNVDIGVYSLDKTSRTLNSSGSLPSGGVYASLAGLNADFSWEISGEFSFSLKPESLPSLVGEYNIRDQAGLDVLEEKKAGEIERFILQRLGPLGENEVNMQAILLEGSLPEMDREVLNAFPEIENFSCLVRTARYPDYALYYSVKELYQEYLDRQQAILREDVIREAETRINSRLRLDELARYGDLLTRYPVLMQFLALEKGLLFPAAGENSGDQGQASR